MVNTWLNPVLARCSHELVCTAGSRCHDVNNLCTSVLTSVFNSLGIWSAIWSVIQSNSRSFAYIAQIITAFRFNGPSAEHLTHSQLIQAVLVRLRERCCCALCSLHVTEDSSLASESEVTAGRRYKPLFYVKINLK